MSHYRQKSDRHNPRLPPRVHNYTAKISESFRQRLPPESNYTDSSWQSLPEWEKMFWEKVSGMSWESFIEAEAYVDKTDKVYDWDDSAGKEALDNAKQRCYAEFHGLPCKKLSFQDADLYIDHIYWSPPEANRHLCSHNWW